MKTLTWKLLGTPPPGLRRDRVIATLTPALAAWEKVCNVRFEERPDVRRVDIAIGFRRFKADQPEPSATRRHEDGSCLITFDSEVKWCPGKPGFFGWLKRCCTPIGLGSLDLLSHALHELGHALGLEHSETETSVMYRWPEASGVKDRPTAEDAYEAALRHPYEDDRRSWRS